jgi:glyoxylase-like metal-dependent hydrolase (beta-lactamase superfamily II)
MKKLIRNFLIGIASIVALLFGLLFYSFSQTLPVTEHRQLSGGAVQVKDGLDSVGMIPSGDHRVALVDCGDDPQANAIMSELNQRGLEKEAVQAILITHAHPDHVAGCAVFSGAEIFAMAAEQPLLEGRVAAHSVAGRLMGKNKSVIHATRYLQDGDSFQVGNLAVTAYLVPGDTDGSAAYLAAGTLYLGDSADGGKNGKLLPAKGLVSNDVQQNRDSLYKLAQTLRPQAAQIQFMEFAHSGRLWESGHF